MSEWLRRQTWNLLGYARAGSNPAVDVLPMNMHVSSSCEAHSLNEFVCFFFLFFFSIHLSYIIRWLNMLTHIWQKKFKKELRNEILKCKIWSILKIKYILSNKNIFVQKNNIICILGFLRNIFYIIII